MHPLLRSFCLHALVASAAMIASSALAASPPQDADRREDSGLVLAIDPAQRFQIIEGFGASGAWWTNYVAEFPDDERAAMLRLLFTSAGADLSIYRCNLPAGDGDEIVMPFRKTAQVEVEPGQYDFSRDWKSRQILREVRALGVERFVLFAKSPPPRLLINGLVSGGPEGGSNLRPEARKDFARYLLDVSASYAKEFELPHWQLSPINEPQWRWGKDWRSQEGCYYTPEELAATMRAFVEVARERGMQVELEGPESGEWKSSYRYAEAMFADPVLAKELSSFAVHSYWSNRADKERFASWFRERYPDKRLAMTEYCQMEHGHDLSIEGGLHLANVMHHDLTLANVVSWQWWLAIASGGYKDGLIYAHPETRVMEPTRRLWVMGNFSRFVRPGSTRIAAEGGSDVLQVSAYLSPDQGSVAVVMINHGEEASVSPNLPGGAMEQAQAFVTSTDRDLAPLAVDSTGRLRLPARSVTTLVVPISQSASVAAEG
jgi:O-glycosyl hydrolase